MFSYFEINISYSVGRKKEFSNVVQNYFVDSRIYSYQYLNIQFCEARRKGAFDAI